MKSAASVWLRAGVGSFFLIMRTADRRVRVVHSQQQNVLVRFTGSLALLYTVIEMTPSVSFVSLLFFRIGLIRMFGLYRTCCQLNDPLSIATADCAISRDITDP